MPLFGDVITTGSFTVSSVPVDPKCIIHHRFPRVGDTVTYNLADCTRLGDGATTTFSLDSDGVPTIVGVDGTLGVKYGVYECVITFNGVQETVPVSHLDDATIEATFTLPTQDSEGYSVFTPSAGSRLLYVDPNEPNDTTAGPDADSNNWYTLSTLPIPDDWENPGAVNAYKTIAGAAAARRDGQPDWILLKRGEVFIPTASLDYNGISGASASERQMLIAYGTGDRPWINPATGFSVNNPVVNIFAEAYVGVSGIRIYPTFRDPDHVDFAGFANIEFSSGINVYTGGAPNSTMLGYIFEDNEILFCNGGIGLGGTGGVTDCIVRRNMVSYNYNIDNTTGFSFGSGSSSTDWGILIEDNTLDHNGWYQGKIDVSATGDSGSTTTLTDTGAFAGVDYATVLLTDDTNGGSVEITSHTDDTLTFPITANMDFTSTFDYTIGGGQGGGQANSFNHNMYLRSLNGAIVRNNIIANASSISIKITSTKTDTEQHEMRDFIESTNLVIYNEIGLGGGGNTEDSVETRFKDLRVMDNAIVNMGETQPTGGTLGWGFSMADWEDGVTGNNIIKGSGQENSAVTNVYGFKVSRINNNSILTYNKAIDIGPPTGASVGDQGCLLIETDSANANITGLQILNNDFQQQNTDGLVIADWLDAETSSITISDNRYYASRGDTDSYRRDGVQGTYTAFVTETGETGQTNAAVNYMDIGASIPNYQRERGGTATIDAFITEAKAQEKGSWDSTLSADEVVAYFKTALSDRPDIKFEVVQFLLSGDAVGQTQDINLSSGFGTPKGAIFIRSASWSGYPGDEANAHMSIGFTDGSNMWGSWSMYDGEIDPRQECNSGQFDDAISNRRQSTSNQEAYKIKDTGGFATDKVVIEVTNTDDGASEHQYEALMIAIGGDDVDTVSVFNHDDLGTGTSAVPISVGFEPDIFIGSTVNDAAIQTAASGDRLGGYYMSIGMAINDGSDSQRCINWSADNLVNPADSTSALYNNAVFAKMTKNAATADYTVALSNFGSDGFDLTPSASTTNMIFGGMAIKFKKRPKMALVDTTVPTSGNFSLTDAAFKPGFGFWVNQSGVTSMNTPQQVNQCIGFTPFDGTTTVSINLNNEHNVTPDDTAAWGSIAPEFSLMVKGGANTIDTVSTGDTFTDSGVDFTTTANPPTSEVLGFMLLMGIN